MDFQLIINYGYFKIFETKSSLKAEKNSFIMFVVLTGCAYWVSWFISPSTIGLLVGNLEA